MKRKRLQLLLALLVTAATGAWAQSTTHVVTQSTVDDIFSGDGYTLGDDVKEGDVLDFQGTIELEGEASHSLVINKQVTVISSTKDAVIKLHTVAGFFMDNTLGSRFIINKAGSGTKVQGIRIENTETWLYNTSNVTFTGVTMSVEDALVGSGKGHVSIRYSDHVTFDGCTVFTRNNGGSTCFVLTGSSNCTFKNSSFQSAGNTGTIFYLSPSNVGDMPEGFPTENNIPMSNDNSVLNCTFSHEESTATRNILISFYRNRLEGCKMTNVSIGIASGGIDPKSPEQGCIYRNNTVNGPNGLTLLAYSTAVGNTVTGSVTLNQGATATNNTITGKVTVKKGSTVTGNTINGNVTVSANSSDYTGSTITGNTINGTVTFATNSKNNTLTRNVITSTGSYAVVMASTADANNTVQYNTLIAATKKGDEAVNPSNVSGNTISNNSNIALMLADGTKDAANWTATVGTSTTANPLPVGGLNEGDAVTMKYNGRLKVKSVTATTDAGPDPLATPLTIEAITAGTIEVNMTGELSTGMKYSVNGGTPTLITTTTSIEGLKAGDKVQFYGNGTSTKVYGYYPEVRIQGSGDGFKTKVYGNIMSLLDEEGFATKTDLQNAEYVFYGLFRYNTTLIDASELLLPATTLASQCYQQMFEFCTSLITAPKLPATTLAEYSYFAMFVNCSNLTAAPALPAPTLKTTCYANMFEGCFKLSSVTCLATSIGASQCLDDWLKDAGTDASVTSRTLYVDPTMVSDTGWKNGSFTVTAITQ